MIWTNGNKGAECIWLKRIRYGRLLKVDYLFNAQKSEMLSDVVLANVEALVDGEMQPTNCPGGRHLCAWINNPIDGSVTYYDRNGDDTI